MNNTSREKKAKACGELGLARLGTALPLVLCVLSSGGASWAQGYGTGAAGGRAITPGNLPGSDSSGMARPGSGDSGQGGIYGRSSIGPIKERKTYPLGPEDVISVTIERFPNYSANNIVIPPDGRISLPYFKPQEINVNRMTAPQLEKILTSRINNRIRNPKISVSIQRFRSAVLGYVNVIGAVQAQGAIEILDGYRLTDIMAKVGGVKGRYDEVEAFLSRDKKRIPIDLHKAVSYQQDEKFNIKVKAGDGLIVTSMDFGRVEVTGDVVRRGVYDLRKYPVANASELPLKPRLSDLVVAAGGFVNNDKLLNGQVSGFVQRGSQRIDLRVDDAIKFKDEAANIALQAGDKVTFDVELPLPIKVLGLVRTPGTYRVPPGAGILEATATAGGLVRDPLQTTGTLQRDGLSRPIDFSKLLAGDKTEDLKLKAGDTINLTSPDTLQVSIAGAVTEPSKGDGLNLRPGDTISTAIARSGGIRLQPDRVAITVIRTMPDGNQRFLSVDPVALQERNDPSQNLKLENGDIINVLEKRVRTASISGEVIKTGPYSVDENGEDLATFIAGAGGARDTAMLSEVSIKSTDGTIKTVDAYEAVTNGRTLNVLVRDGDLVSVPRNQNRILINGAVARQGVVTLPERRPMTVLDAVAAAGGSLPGANTKEVVLVRARPDGTPTTRKLNLSEVRNGNIADARLTLQNGDILVLPEAKAKRDAVSTGLSLFSIFNLARSVLR